MFCIAMDVSKLRERATMEEPWVAAVPILSIMRSYEEKALSGRVVTKLCRLISPSRERMEVLNWAKAEHKPARTSISSIEMGAVGSLSSRTYSATGAEG